MFFLTFLSPTLRNNAAAARWDLYTFLRATGIGVNVRFVLNLNSTLFSSRDDRIESKKQWCNDQYTSTKSRSIYIGSREIFHYWLSRIRIKKRENTITWSWSLRYNRRYVLSCDPLINVLINRLLLFFAI